MKRAEHAVAVSVMLWPVGLEEATKRVFVATAGGVEELRLPQR
jgi:hypothetical protein